MTRADIDRVIAEVLECDVASVESGRVRLSGRHDGFYAHLANALEASLGVFIDDDELVAWTSWSDIYRTLGATE